MAQTTITKGRPRVGWRLVAVGIGVVLSIAVAGYGLAHLVGASFPPAIRANQAGLAILSIHATTAAVALLIGPFQFSARLRNRRRRLHRYMGRVYVAACLIGGVSGAALAWGGVNGDLARAGFGLLAALWLTTTIMAWVSARAADFAQHRIWMIRSFALTFAAVTLRLYLPMSMVAGFSFEAAYPFIAWACWAPNLVIAEWWLRRGALARA